MDTFTVPYDLLSVSNSTHSQPFTDFKPARISQRRVQELETQARKEIYREENERLFNPFDHRLAKGFGMSEEDVFLREKERLQQDLRRKEEDRDSHCRSYTIVFNDNKKTQSRSHDTVFKMCANSMLGSSNVSEQEQREEEGEVHKIRGTDRHFRNQPKSAQKVSKQNSSDTQIHPSSRQQPKPITGIKPPLVNPRPPLGPHSKVAPKPAPIKIVTKDSPSKFSHSYQGQDMNLVEQLEREIIENPDVSFESIAQLETAKQLLQEAVLLPKLMPEFFQGIRRATKGILLFGPPGTGKTMLAKAVARGNVFFNVSASSIASKWRGESEKLVRILFEMAKFHAPSVIFFDEIDALGSKRSEEEGEANRKVKTELLVQMDGVNSDPKKHVFVLAATNRPWDLDQALRRRLEKRIYIPLPQQNGRKQMFQLNLKTVKTDPNIDYNKLARLTKDYSGADIAIVCREAAYLPLRRKVDSLGGYTKIADMSQLQKEIDVPMTLEDLIVGIKNTSKSVGSNDLKRYQQWMREFGST